MPYSFILPIVIPLVILFIIFETGRHPVTAFWFKGFASFGFVALGASAILVTAGAFDPAAYLDANFYLPFVLGLVCGLLGDLFLALRSLRPEAEDRRLIVGGTICFAAGHVFYYGALIFRFGISGVVLLVALLLTIVIDVAARFMKMRWGEAKYPCLVYTFLVFLVACQGVYAFTIHPESTLTHLLLAGGLLFAISDLVLSQIYFLGRGSKPYVIVNLTTYYAAQILLALSLYFL